MYCSAVKEGGLAEWDFLFDRFQNENVAGEQVKLLKSLGCSEETWLLQRYLHGIHVYEGLFATFTCNNLV